MAVTVGGVSLGEVHSRHRAPDVSAGQSVDFALSERTSALSGD